MKTPSFVLGVRRWSHSPRGLRPRPRRLKQRLQARYAGEDRSDPRRVVELHEGSGDPGTGCDALTGNWPGTTANSPHLQLTVAVYTDRRRAPAGHT